ncbi:hypothetical protein SOVF_016040 [Spinacia oleracea]|nr:hypothetical protein SOVF_016040 [Spinacia oleracea]
MATAGNDEEELMVTAGNGEEKLMARPIISHTLSCQNNRPPSLEILHRSSDPFTTAELDLPHLLVHRLPARPKLVAETTVAPPSWSTSRWWWPWN